MHEPGEVDFFCAGFEMPCSPALVDSPSGQPWYTPDAGMSAIGQPAAVTTDDDDDDEDLMLEDLDFDFDEFASPTSPSDDPASYLDARGPATFRDEVDRSSTCGNGLYVPHYAVDADGGSMAPRYMDLSTAQSPATIVDENDVDWFQTMPTTSRLHDGTLDDFRRPRCAVYTPNERYLNTRVPGPPSLAPNCHIPVRRGLLDGGSVTTRMLRQQMHGGVRSGPAAAPMKRHYQRHAANQRERRRMKTINEAFICLRDRIPTDPHGRSSSSSSSSGHHGERKLSKVDTLRLAVRYIRHLTDVLCSKTTEKGDCEETVDCPSSVEEEAKIILRCRLNPDYDEVGVIGHSLTWQHSKQGYFAGVQQNTVVCSKVWWIPQTDSDTDNSTPAT